MTGRGRIVDISLFESLAEWASEPAYYAHYSGETPLRVGAAHSTIAPYGCYTAADSGVVVLAVQSQREWRGFCAHFLGDPGRADDERFATNSGRVAQRLELDEIVAARCAELSASALKDELESAGLPHGRLKDMHGVWEHEQLVARGRWRTVATPAGPIRAMLPPIDMDGRRPRMDDVPANGQHTDAVLSRLGLTD